MTNTSHRVPLSAAALAVLEQVRPFAEDGIVFPGRRRGQALSHGALLYVLDHDMGADATVHGFRATFKTWASERTGYAREVVEAALSHTIPGELERAYRRGDLLDKRARLMAEWAAYCLAKPGAAVVPLRRPRPRA